VRGEVIKVMRRIFKIISMVVVLCTSFLLPSGSVRAAGEDDGVGASPKPFVVMDSEAGIDSVVDNINYEIRKKLPEGSVASNWKFLEFEAGTKQVKLDREKYTNLSADNRKEVMAIALDHLAEKNSGMGARDRARLHKFVADQDVQISRVLRAVNKDIRPDLAEGIWFVRQFKWVLNPILGVLVMVICAMVSLSIALDLCVMNIPPFMNWLQRKYGSKKPPFVSIEAWTAYRDSVIAVSYVDYTKTYLLRSIPKLIITGFCLFIIITGNILTISIWLADFFMR
jgi:hypothetical protein